MTNKYNWNITQLDCYPSVQGESDVVFNVHWEVIGNDSNGHIGRVYGTQSINLNPDDSFIPYNELTQQQVIDWVSSAMGSDKIADIHFDIDEQIERQVNPPVISPALPW